jgi:hypothetical protein
LLSRAPFVSKDNRKLLHTEMATPFPLRNAHRVLPRLRVYEYCRAGYFEMSSMNEENKWHLGTLPRPRNEVEAIRSTVLMLLSRASFGESA